MESAFQECLRLLSGIRDEEKLVGLLMVTKLLVPREQEDATVDKVKEEKDLREKRLLVLEALGTNFLERLLAAPPCPSSSRSVRDSATEANAEGSGFGPNVSDRAVQQTLAIGVISAFSRDKTAATILADDCFVQPIADILEETNDAVVQRDCLEYFHNLLRFGGFGIKALADNQIILVVLRWLRRSPNVTQAPSAAEGKSDTASSFNRDQNGTTKDDNLQGSEISEASEINQHVPNMALSLLSLMIHSGDERLLGDDEAFSELAALFADDQSDKKIRYLEMLKGWVNARSSANICGAESGLLGSDEDTARTIRRGVFALLTTRLNAQWRLEILELVLSLCLAHGPEWAVSRRSLEGTGVTNPSGMEDKHEKAGAGADPGNGSLVCLIINMAAVEIQVLLHDVLQSCNLKDSSSSKVESEPDGMENKGMEIVLRALSVCFRLVELSISYLSLEDGEDRPLSDDELVDEDKEQVGSGAACRPAQCSWATMSPDRLLQLQKCLSSLWTTLMEFVELVRQKCASSSPREPTSVVSITRVTTQLAVSLSAELSILMTMIVRLVGCWVMEDWDTLKESFMPVLPFLLRLPKSALDLGFLNSEWENAQVVAQMIEVDPLRYLLPVLSEITDEEHSIKVLFESWGVCRVLLFLCDHLGGHVDWALVPNEEASLDVAALVVLLNCLLLGVDTRLGRSTVSLPKLLQDDAIFAELLSLYVQVYLYIIRRWEDVKSIRSRGTALRTQYLVYAHASCFIASLLEDIDAEQLSRQLRSKNIDQQDFVLALRAFIEEGTDVPFPPVSDLWCLAVRVLHRSSGKIPYLDAELMDSGLLVDAIPRALG